jgi:hypothetical protein
MCRTCDACQKPIDQDACEYLEIQIRVLKTDEGAEQDEQRSVHGDFCNACVGNGRAVESLLQSLEWKCSPEGSTDPSAGFTRVGETFSRPLSEMTDAERMRS